MNYKIKLFKDNRESKVITVTKNQYNIIENNAIEGSQIKYGIEVIKETTDKMKYSDLIEWGNFENYGKI